MRFGAPEVQAGWVEGRTIVVAGASVITMGPNGDFVGDVVLRDDHIVAVGIGAGTDVPDDALRIDASGAVVIPGLIDGHVHAWEGALRAATIGGALAAGLPDVIGTLVAGSKADLTLISLDRLRPVASHLGAAVAYASASDVDTVVVDGILRKSGGELVGVDRARLVREAEASRDRLLGEIGTSAEELRFAGQLTPPARES
jgi:cytosine/adenosine deaminase-related metal-dependent hydrolase